MNLPEQIKYVQTHYFLVFKKYLLVFFESSKHLLILAIFLGRSQYFLLGSQKAFNVFLFYSS